MAFAWGRGSGADDRRELVAALTALGAEAQGLRVVWDNPEGGYLRVGSAGFVAMSPDLNPADYAPWGGDHDDVSPADSSAIRAVALAWEDRP